MAMKQFLPYFASSVVSVLLGYLINQLEPIPNHLRPWVILSVVLLTFLGAFLFVSQGSTSSSGRLSIRDNVQQGKGHRIDVGNSDVVHNRQRGEDHLITDRPEDSSGGQP
jgi:hypothetical protein